MVQPTALNSSIGSPGSLPLVLNLSCLVLGAGLLIFRGKKSKISRDFQGQIRGKIGRFRGIFAGRKSKFAERSADFWYFCKKKSKFAEKSADFAGFSRKKVKFRRIFRGKFLEKSADFTGNFVGKLRHETISKKQLISLDFLGEISLKSIKFYVDVTSVV